MFKITLQVCLKDSETLLSRHSHGPGPGPPPPPPPPPPPRACLCLINRGIRLIQLILTNMGS